MQAENPSMREAVGTIVDRIDPELTRPGVEVRLDQVPYPQREFLLRDMGFGDPLITEDIAEKTRVAIAADVARWQREYRVATERSASDGTYHP